MTYSSEELRKLISEQEAELRAPGTVLFSQARYELLRVLGEGGMGITCLANEITASNMKRPIVLKFLKDSLDPDRLAQFLNEVQLAIIFNHPNLVPMYRLETEVITINRTRSRGILGRSIGHTVYYAVMQYIDGWNLRQVVDRLRTLGIALNYDMTMFTIGRVARGLHYVHEYRNEQNVHLGLVHRDISPENILFDRFGRIKVADFGLTKSGHRVPGEALARAGKLQYCSPEQLDGEKLDARSDIYNIGLLLYYLFTDVGRFAREATMSGARDRVRRKMQRSPLPDLKHVPPRLGHVCDICLRESPNERYQSCEDLATDIDIYFKETQKVVTNEQLEDILNDLFRDNPTFVSRRFIPLTGSPRLEQPGFNPNAVGAAEEINSPMATVKVLPSGELGP